MKKNFVSFNAKYYKNSNASGEIGHVQRVYAENTNQIKEFAKDNFGCGYNIYDRYKDVFKQVEGVKGKKIQENANTFMDGVLSFSRDQMLEIMQDPDWKTSFSDHIEHFMQDVKEKTGMEPLGWEMHMDEGHKNPETGEYEMNYHAQCIFFNYDFKTNTAPLRKLMDRKSDSIWSKLQDTAGQRFEDLGFVRGVSADMTKAKHKKKDDYIASKQAEIDRLQAELAQRQIQQDQAIRFNQELLEQVAEKVDVIVEEFNAQGAAYNSLIERVHLEREVRKDIKNMYNEVKDMLNDNPIFKNLQQQLRNSFPDFYDKSLKFCNKVAAYFNADSGDGELLPLLKETRENAIKLKSLNDELKNRNGGKFKF
jgi:hypothetical protein